MVIYIYLIWHGLVIFCSETAGCVQTSSLFFQQLLEKGGILELMFEIAGIIKIYRKLTKIEVGEEVP